jgi:hypothetical protein
MSMMKAIEGVFVYKCDVRIGSKVSSNEGPVFMVIDWKERQVTITEVRRIEYLSV